MVRTPKLKEYCILLYLFIFASCEMVFGRIVLQSFTDTYDETHPALFKELRTLSVGEHFDFYNPEVEETAQVTFALHYKNSADQWHLYIPGMPSHAYPLENEASMAYPTKDPTNDWNQLSLRRYLQLHSTVITRGTVVANSFHLLLPNFTTDLSPMIARICPYIKTQAQDFTSSPCSPIFSYQPIREKCIVTEGALTLPVSFGNLSPAHETYTTGNCERPALLHPYCISPHTDPDAYQYNGLNGPNDISLQCLDNVLCQSLDKFDSSASSSQDPLLDAISRESVVVYFNGQRVPTASNHIFNDLLDSLQYHINHPLYDESIIGTVNDSSFMHPEHAFSIPNRLLPLPSEDEFIRQWRITPAGQPLAATAVITGHAATDRDNTKWDTTVGKNPPFIAYGVLRCSTTLPDHTPAWQGTLTIVTHREVANENQFISPQHNCIIDGPEEARRYGRRVLPGPDVAPITGPLRAFYPRGIFGIPELAVVRLGYARFTCIDGFVPARDVNPTEDTVLCEPTTESTTGQWGQLGRPHFVGHTTFRCVPDVPTCSLEDLYAIDASLSPSSLIQDIVYYEGDYLRFFSKIEGPNTVSRPLPPFRPEFGRNTPPQCRVDGNNKPYWFWKRNPTKFPGLDAFSTLETVVYSSACIQDMIAMGDDMHDYDGKVSFPTITNDHSYDMKVLKLACAHPQARSIDLLEMTFSFEEDIPSTSDFNDATLMCGELVLQPEVELLGLSFRVPGGPAANSGRISYVSAQITGCTSGYVLNPMYYSTSTNLAEDNMLELSCAERQLFWTSQVLGRISRDPVVDSKPTPFAPSSSSICIPKIADSQQSIIEPTSFGGQNPLDFQPVSSTINLYTCNPNGASFHPSDLAYCSFKLALAQTRFESSDALNIPEGDDQPTQFGLARGTITYLPRVELKTPRKVLGEDRIRQNLGFSGTTLPISTPEDHPRAFLGLNSRSFKVEFYSILQGKVARSDVSGIYSTLPTQLVAGRLGKTDANRFDEFYYDPLSGAWENPYRIQISDLTLRHGTTYCPVESLHGLHLSPADRTEHTDTLYSYGSNIYTSRLPQHGLPKDGLLIVAPKPGLVGVPNPEILYSYRQGKFSFGSRVAYRCQRDGTLGHSPTSIPTFSPMSRDKCLVPDVVKVRQYSHGTTTATLAGYQLEEPFANGDAANMVSLSVSSLASFFTSNPAHPTVIYPGHIIAPEALQCVHWGNQDVAHTSFLLPSARLGGRVMPRHHDRSWSGSLYLGAECTPNGWRYRRPDLQRSVLSPLVIRSLVDPALPYNRATTIIHRSTSTVEFPRNADRPRSISGSDNIADLFHCLSFNNYAAPDIKDIYWIGRSESSSESSAPWSALTLANNPKQPQMVIIPAQTLTVAIAAGDKTDFALTLNSLPHLFLSPHRLIVVSVECKNSAECEPNDSDGRNAFNPPASIIRFYAEKATPSDTTTHTSLTTLLQKNSESSPDIIKGCRIGYDVLDTSSLTYGYPSSALLTVFAPRPFSLTPSIVAVQSSTFYAAECASHRGYFPPQTSSLDSPLPWLGCFYDLNIPTMKANWYMTTKNSFVMLSSLHPPCSLPTVIFHTSSVGSFSDNEPQYETAILTPGKDTSLWISGPPVDDTSYIAGRRLEISFRMKNNVSGRDQSEDKVHISRSDWSFVNPLLSTVPWKPSTAPTFVAIEMRYTLQFHPLADMFLPALSFSNLDRVLFLHASDIQSIDPANIYPELYLRMTYIRTCTSYLPADFSFNFADAQINAVTARSYIELKARPDCTYCPRYIVEPDGGAMVAEIAHGQPLSRLIRRRIWEIFAFNQEEEVDPDIYLGELGTVNACENSMYLYPAFGDATLAGQAIAPSNILPRGRLCNSEGIMESEHSPLSGFEPPEGPFNIDPSGSNISLVMHDYALVGVDMFAPCLPAPIFKNDFNSYITPEACRRDITIQDVELRLPARFFMQRYISNPAGADKELPLDFPSQNEPAKYALHLSSILPGAQVALFRDLTVNIDDITFPITNIPSTLRTPISGENLSDVVDFEPTDSVSMVKFKGSTKDVQAENLSYSLPFNTITGVDELVHHWLYHNRDHFVSKFSLPQIKVFYSLGLSIKLERNKARQLVSAILPTRRLIPVALPQDGSYTNVLEIPNWRSPMRHESLSLNLPESSGLGFSTRISASDLKGETITDWDTTLQSEWRQPSGEYIIPFNRDGTEVGTAIGNDFSLVLQFSVETCNKHSFLAKHYSGDDPMTWFGEFSAVVSSSPSSPQQHCKLKTDFPIAVFSPDRFNLSFQTTAYVLDCFDVLDASSLSIDYIPSPLFSNIPRGAMVDFTPSVTFVRLPPFSLVTMILSLLPRSYFAIDEVPIAAYTPYFLSETTSSQVNLADLPPEALLPGALPLFAFHYSFSYYSSPWVQVETPRDRFIRRNDPRHTFSYQVDLTCLEKDGSPMVLSDLDLFYKEYPDDEGFSYVGILPRVAEVISGGLDRTCTFKVTARLESTLTDEVKITTKVASVVFSRTDVLLTTPTLSISPIKMPITVSGATLSPGFSGSMSEAVSTPLTALGILKAQESVQVLENYTPELSQLPTNSLVAVVSQLSSFSLSLTLKIAPTAEFKDYYLQFVYPDDQDIPNPQTFFNSLYKQTSKVVYDGSSETKFTFQFTAQRSESVISQRKHVYGLFLFHAKVQSRDNLLQIRYFTEAVMILAVAPPFIVASVDSLTQEEANAVWETSNPHYLHTSRKISFIDTNKSLAEIQPKFIENFSAALPSELDNEGVKKSPVKVYVGDSFTSRVFTKTLALDQKEPFVIGVCERVVKLTTVVQDFLGVTTTLLPSVSVAKFVEEHPTFESICPQIANLSPALLPSPAIILAYLTVSQETTSILEKALSSDLCASSISDAWTVVSLVLSTLNSFDRYTELAWIISLPVNTDPTSPGYPNGTMLYDHSSEAYISTHALFNRITSSLEALGLQTCFVDTIALREFSSAWAANISPPRKASSFMTSLKGWTLKHTRLANTAQRQRNIKQLLSTFDIMSRSLGVNDQAPIFAIQNVVHDIDMALDGLSHLLKNSESKETVSFHLRTRNGGRMDVVEGVDDDDDDEDRDRDSLVVESRALLSATMTLLSTTSSVAFLGVQSAGDDEFLLPSSGTVGGVVDMATLPQFSQTGSNLHVSLTFLPKNLTFTSLNDAVSAHQHASSVQIPGSVLNVVTQTRNVVSSFFTLSNAELGRAALGRDLSETSGDTQTASHALGVVSLSLLDGQTGNPIDITQRLLFEPQDHVFGTRSIPKVYDEKENEKNWFFIEIPFFRDANNVGPSTTISAASKCVYTEDMAALAEDSTQEWEHNDSCQLHEITVSSVVCRCNHLTFFSVRFSAQSFIPRFQEITMDQIRQVNWANVTRNLIPVIILLIWPLLTILVMFLARRLDVRYYRQGIEKLLLDWNAREQHPVTKKEVYKVTNSDSVFYIIWRRYWYAIRDTHIWFSVFMRQTTHNYSSMSRALTGMVLMLSSFTLSGVFSGYTNQGFITVVIMTSACLFVISELLRFVFDRTEKDRIKRFIYYYAESLAYFYFTGKSMLFPVSEHETLMQQRPTTLVEKGGAELSSLVLSLGWEAVPMGAVHAHINRDVPLQESRTVFDKQIVRQYAFGDVDTFYYRARNHEYRLSPKEAGEIHHTIRRTLPQAALSANDISNKFHNQPFLDLLPSAIRLFGLSLVAVWVVACYFLVIVNASALASNRDTSVTQSPVSDWVTSAGLSLLLDIFVTSFALGFVKSTGFYCLSYLTKCCCCRQPTKFYGSDDSLKVNSMPNINTYRRLTYFEPLTDVEMTNFNCANLKGTENTNQSNATAKIYELADKPDEEDIDEDDNFGATDDTQFSAQLNKVGPSLILRSTVDEKAVE